MEIAVIDTGIGIAPADQEAVFEEFRQVGTDYMSKQEGTGLGLALTRRFVELHGGRIWLDERGGQRLDVSLHPTGQHTRIMSMILIVEDNPRNMKLVRDVLQVKGYTTLEATNAEDGIVLAKDRMPDLVLMDIQLPGMNGIEALGQLRADPSTARIPVIAVTASVMQQDRKLITEAGFDGYIGKPINLAEFLQTVTAQLARGLRP